MLPVFHNGDIVAVLNKSLVNIAVGDVVTFRKNKKIMIKKVENKSDSSFSVEGYNSLSSIDSRHFGEVQKNDIIGKVILTLHPHR